MTRLSLTIGADAVFAIPSGANVAYDQATITGAGAAAIEGALTAAKAASPVQYTSTQGSLGGLFSTPSVTTVYYGGTDAPGSISAAGKDLVLTNTSACEQRYERC